MSLISENEKASGPLKWAHQTILQHWWHDHCSKIKISDSYIPLCKCIFHSKSLLSKYFPKLGQKKKSSCYSGGIVKVGHTRAHATPTFQLLYQRYYTLRYQIGSSILHVSTLCCSRSAIAILCTYIYAILITATSCFSCMPTLSASVTIKNTKLWHCLLYQAILTKLLCSS